MSGSRRPPKIRRIGREAFKEFSCYPGLLFATGVALLDCAFELKTMYIIPDDPA